MAKRAPNKILVTRAQAKARAKVEHERQLRHAVDGATPISVDSIQDDETVILSDYSDTDTPSNSDCLEDSDFADSLLLEVPPSTHSGSASPDDLPNHSPMACPPSTVASTPIEPLPDVSVYSDAMPNASNSISHLVPFPHLQFDGISKSDFIKLQRSDSSTTHIWSWAEQGVKRCFVVEDV